MAKVTITDYPSDQYIKTGVCVCVLMCKDFMDLHTHFSFTNFQTEIKILETHTHTHTTWILI